MSVYVNDGSPTEWATTQVGGLFIRALRPRSSAFRVSTIVGTDASVFVVPTVTDDPDAGWYAEGEEITPSDPTKEDLEVIPRKVAGLTLTSNEAWADNPQVQLIVMTGLARDVARKIDAAYWSATPIAKAPAGVGQLAGVTELDAGASWANFDVFDEAALEVEALGYELGAYVANTDTAKALHAVKVSTGSNQSLLQPTASERVLRSVRGVPLLVDDNVAADTVFGIPSEASLAVVRSDVELTTSADAFFSSDRFAVRVTARVAFAFPHPEAVVKVTLSE